MQNEPEEVRQGLNYALRHALACTINCVLFFFFFFFFQSNAKIYAGILFQINNATNKLKIRVRNEGQNKRKFRLSPCSPLLRTQGPQGGDAL